MQSIIDRNIPVERRMILTETAIELYERKVYTVKQNFFGSMDDLYAPVFSINGHVNFFYGHVLLQQDVSANFGIERYYDGLLLRFPVPGKMEELETGRRTGQTFRNIQGT